MVNFYRHHFPNEVRIQALLDQLLEEDKQRHTMNYQAFSKSVWQLGDAPLINHPVQGVVLTIHSDVSDIDPNSLQLQKFRQWYCGFLRHIDWEGMILYFCE